ncbi:DUF143-domain-containing protein [Backusella circina FSU 941]|nr:DUF143-domain-containing protein [Backusella circina FSU 941]
MFRLTRLASKVTPVLGKPIVTTSRIYASPATWRHFSQSPWQWNNKVTTPHDLKQSQQEEDDLEEIDPKDYPELYPDENGLQDQQVDTEWFIDPEYADESNLSEKDFIPMWQRKAVGDHLEDRLALQQVSKELMASGKLTADTIKDLLEESKMDNVQLIDVREKCDWADYMIVASSGKGDKYISGVADHLGSVVKKAIQSNPDSLKTQPSPRIEGRDDKSGWVLIDLGKVIVHLFTPEVRERYDLEGLWHSVSTDPTEPMKID